MRNILEKIRMFVRQRFKHVQIERLMPNRRELYWVAFAVVVLFGGGVALVLSTNTALPGSVYLNAVINEAPGMSLLDATGMLGLLALSVYLVFLCHPVARVANGLLVGVAWSSVFALGVITGQLVIEFPVALSILQTVVLVIATTLLVSVAVGQSLMVWYFSWAVAGRGGHAAPIFHVFSPAHWGWRVTIGLLLGWLVITLFLTSI